MSLLLLAAAVVISAAPARQEQGSAEAAYQVARTEYYALKKDTARRKLRHHWQNVAKRFEKVAQRFPKSDRAPDALYTAAEMLAELSRISGAEEDLDAAIADYRRLVEQHSGHKLADDGALALARIYFERRGEPERARSVIEGALANGRASADKNRALRSLLAKLPAEKPKKEKRAAPLQEAIAKAATQPPAPLPAPSVPEANHPEPSPKAELPEWASREEAQERPLPRLAAIREQLRTVRVGTPENTSAALPADPAQAELAKQRLEKAAKLGTGQELSLAEQLGLKVRRVVIDAGHGGHDTGAIGGSGLLEKDVTLSISKKLAEKLEQTGLTVVLSREDDTYVSLENRAKLANEVHGDLFISVHCNSAVSKKLRGIETYSLNVASDRYSIRLAARENASTERGVGDLQFILADLATKANTGESTRLAAKVQRSLVRAITSKHPEVKDLGTKEALFYVLLGARMPAILVETSFLSNPEEEKLLASESYQDEIAQAIAVAVGEFLGERERIAKVD